MAGMHMNTPDGDEADNFGDTLSHALTTSSRDTVTYCRNACGQYDVCHAKLRFVCTIVIEAVSFKLTIPLN